MEFLVAGMEIVLPLGTVPHTVWTCEKSLDTPALSLDWQCIVDSIPAVE